MPLQDFERLDGENEEQFIWRICQAKDSGYLDLSWDEVADIINKNFREDESQYRTEAAYRKPFQQAKRFYESGVFNKLSEDKYLKDLEEKKHELQIEKVKFRDERTELNRTIREEARKEGYKELILRSIKEYEHIPLEYDRNKQFNGIINSDNDLIISLTDIHTGIEIDNFYNKFNTEILKKRMNKYLDKIFEVKTRHNSQDCYVILSELVSGIIHNELRIENNQNLIEQFLTAIDYVSQFLSELSYQFNEVNVFMCAGNHSRISPKKEDSLKGENMDHLAIPFLHAKLQNFLNITYSENVIEESVAMFGVRGKNIMAVHGDKDDPQSIVQKFSMMFHVIPDIVYLGHRHVNGMTTIYNSKVIQSGSMSGIDNYCLDKRLNGKPSQTISVITKNGLDCLYDVALD